ncbi:MAG: amidohydrolase [Thermoplasmatota archaeon]
MRGSAVVGDVFVREGVAAGGVLWRGGRIRLVGTAGEVRREALRGGLDVMEADGGCITPGFVDAHAHFVPEGLRGVRLDLEGAASRKEALERLTKWLRSHPGDGAVVGEGWDESGWPDGSLERRDIEAASEKRPIVLRRVCGHLAVANGAALAVVETRWPVDDSGILMEEPSLYLGDLFPIPADVLDEAVSEACRVAHSLGVTSVGEYARAPHRAALERAARAGRLTVRVFGSLYPQELDDALARGFRTGRPAGDAWLRDGGLKVFLDGSLGAHSAALREPYDDATSRGHLNWGPEALQGLFSKAAAAGIQIHAHAIGDAAIDQGLEAFAALGPRNPLRHRFEHFELAHDDQLAKVKRLGLVASCQPNFAGPWMEPGGLYAKRLGSRVAIANRFRTIREQGIPLAFGSDGMPFGPLPGLRAALRHPNPSERLTVAKAIGHYTSTAAWSLHAEDLVGSLDPGKAADLVWMTGQKEDPETWAIRQTWTDGIPRLQ